MILTTQKYICNNISHLLFYIILNLNLICFRYFLLKCVQDDAQMEEWDGEINIKEEDEFGRNDGHVSAVEYSLQIQNRRHNGRWPK